MNLFTTIIVIQIIFYAAASKWTYEKQDDWPSTCKGSSQSPINIIVENIIPTKLEEFSFNSAFFEPKNATVVNNGHSVQVQLIDDGNPPTISGGGLDGEYVLEQFHFHWSAEHTINGYRFPLEAHLVFYAKKYNNFGTALKYKNGVAVLGVFYDIFPVYNSGFDILALNVPAVARNVSEPKQLSEPLTVNTFLPLNTFKYLRYEGSLTTPDCNEGIVWTLFATHSYISIKQFNRLTRISDYHGNLLTSNYRQVQKLNDRKVFLVL